MSRKFLLSLIFVLIITNISTLLVWKKDRHIILDEPPGIIIRDNGNVANINGKEVSYEEWVHSILNKYGADHLKTMINREVVRQLANEKEISIHDKIIDREIALLATMQGVLTEEEIKEEERKWREDIVYRYQLETLLAEDINIPETDINDFYNNYKGQYDFEGSVQLSHIVVSNSDEAEKVMHELNSGASFSEVALEYSLDEETALAGGYLGYYSSTSQLLPQNYFKVASELQEGFYSEPFKNNSGVAIVYLHRFLSPITFTYEEVKPYIKNELALHKINQPISAEVLWDKFDINWVYED